MSNNTEIFNRIQRLIGQDSLDAIANRKVLLFGVGGVGSWCAEGLVRSGITHLTIADPDLVNVTNINRQLMATTETLDQPKVEVLKARLLSINPQADVTAIQAAYNATTMADYDLSSYDYVIDAIDSLQDKALLILNATSASCCFVSSMGAALKIDPQKIEVSEFWKVRGCPLARALRKRFKHMKRYPAHKFNCVYSPEVLPNMGEMPTTTDVAPSSYADPKKAQINGSMVHITAIFGFTISGLIIQDIIK